MRKHFFFSNFRGCGDYLKSLLSPQLLPILADWFQNNVINVSLYNCLLLSQMCSFDGSLISSATTMNHPTSFSPDRRPMILPPYQRRASITTSDESSQIVMRKYVNGTSSANRHGNHYKPHLRSWRLLFVVLQKPNSYSEKLLLSAMFVQLNVLRFVQTAYIKVFSHLVITQ